mmetsp:Transcript_48824/g.59078  ORF Transcript_48824/g.59078 Transcript_48824/m.59078 type:complete len:568 (+) Transcript_48824:275-1978(+)
MRIFNNTLQRHLVTRGRGVNYRRSLSTLITKNGSDDGNNLIVIGSGIAGCATALTCAMRYSIPVTLLHAGDSLVDCNSYWAQGGIIYRNPSPGAGDSAEGLMKDVHRAGAGLCLNAAVEKVAREGPRRVEELLLGVAKVPFDRDERGELKFCLEASHSAARIIYQSDATGKAITSSITRATASHPLITPVPNTVVTDLLVDSQTCHGVRTLDTNTNTTSILSSSRGVVLASGGLANIYEHSTNPSGFNALGSSVALALRAGARCHELEYVQFHPTSLYMPGEARFLLTEALRGEGALLRDRHGTAFAKEFSPQGELAPRDVVARGVFEWSQKCEDEHNVFLDISHRDAEWLEGRFPTIQAHVRERGYDITRDPLPVIPAAHYTCGGVLTDLKGRTCVNRLYAAGEAARTGLHGGNRLASTSLLEGLVFGAAVADDVGSNDTDASPCYARSKETTTSRQNYDDVATSKQMAQSLLQKLRKIMWDKVGVVRTPSGLRSAVQSLQELREEACELYERRGPTLETSAIRDAAFAGEAVAKSAASNCVSAGAHYVVDDEEDEDDQAETQCSV